MDMICSLYRDGIDGDFVCCIKITQYMLVKANTINFSSILVLKRKENDSRCIAILHCSLAVAAALAKARGAVAVDDARCARR